MYAAIDGSGGAGGATQANFTATCAPVDPKVQEAVDQTIAATEFGQPTDGAQAAYQIQQTMARTDLTQAQKDAYIAEIVRLAGNGIGCSKCVDERTQQKLLHGLNDIGTAWTDPATPELRDQVEAAIARGVADGRLDADDLYNLVREPGSHGTRQLLTEVRDGTALSSVAQRLTDDARAQGYDINDGETGPQTLAAAADIANMAAANGNRAGANAVLAEIARVGDKPVAGDMTLTEAMMATTVGGGQWNNLYERDGFHALAGLLNSASQTAANQPALDSLFSDLVRSGKGENYVGGIDEGGDRSPALDQIGRYFERNVERLANDDMLANNTGDGSFRLVQDFMRYVMLDPDYPRVEQTQDALAGTIANLAERADNPNLSQSARDQAGALMGTIMGSIRTAGDDYIANAQGDAEAKVALIRQVTDIFTDKLIGKLKAKLPEGEVRDGAGTAATGVVDALWQKLVDHEAAAARGEVASTTGGLVELLQTVRTSLAESLSAGLVEYSVVGAFDDREDIYHDGD